MPINDFHNPDPSFSGLLTAVAWVLYIMGGILPADIQTFALWCTIAVSVTTMIGNYPKWSKQLATWCKNIKRSIKNLNR